MISEPLKQSLLATLRAQLDEGERIAWVSTPEPSAPEDEEGGVGKWDGAAILGGGYATVGACLMAARTAQWWWLSVPVALLVVGALVFWAAQQRAARARRIVERTVHGYTTRRGLVVRTYPKLVVQSLPLEAITDVIVDPPRDDVADLQLQAAAGAESLVFRQVASPERIRTQLMRVMQNPQQAEQELAQAESYAQQMRELRARTTPRG